MILDTLTVCAWHQIVGKEQGEEVKPSETKINCLQMTLPSVCWGSGSQVRSSTLALWFESFMKVTFPRLCHHQYVDLIHSYFYIIQTLNWNVDTVDEELGEVDFKVWEVPAVQLMGGQLGNTVNKGWKPGDKILSTRQNPLNPNTPTLLIKPFSRSGFLWKSY